MSGKLFSLIGEGTVLSMEVTQASRVVDAAQFTAEGTSTFRFRVMRDGTLGFTVQAVYNGQYWRFVVSRQTANSRETLLDQSFRDGLKLEMSIPSDSYIL